MALKEIAEMGSIARRRRNGRDQARLRSHRAGVHGAKQNAKPADPDASPANR
ncbi:hypothetical protein ACVIIV_000324 [Bradyrhizobium sp. USDA 4354]